MTDEEQAEVSQSVDYLSVLNHMFPYCTLVCQSCAVNVSVLYYLPV